MVHRVHAIPAPLKPLQGFIRLSRLSPSAHLFMSSLNCFKPSPVGTLSHKAIEGSARVVEKSDSDGEDYDAPTVRDHVSCTDDGCSLQSRGRFQSLRCESPRPESNVLVRTLKTASLSARNRSKLKELGVSNPSPMLICVKGHSRKGDTPDSKRKAKMKHTEVKYDSYDSVDLQPQAGNANSNLSCLVRSHSDSTCLTVKASKPPDEIVADSTSQLPSNSQLNVLVTAAEVQNGDGSNSSAPRSTIYSPIYPNPPTPSFGYMPSSPYMTYDGYLGSPQMGGFMGVMTPPTYGTSSMSLGDANLHGLIYPSPQMSPYSLLFQCPHPYTDPFHQRPCSVESCNVNDDFDTCLHLVKLSNCMPPVLPLSLWGPSVFAFPPFPVAGGPLPHASGPRQGLDNSYHPAHIAASPMPPVIYTSNYPRQNHSVSYQAPLSSEDRAPAAPIPARRQFSNQHYHLPPNPPLQRLRSPPPPLQHQQQPLPPLPAHQSQTHTNVQMPSSRGTAFKKVNSSAAPPPYDSLRTVIGDPANQHKLVLIGVIWHENWCLTDIGSTMI
ncbi:unnamed protein product [Hydatigera taeniaeformis]|uniref:BAH domain-containing protein n=1 Tax=Hydatigena taeniaeformis TaxID=6205 RepID=A0A158RF93_HYDTA|nr:unnamed protein product [Hydatigera taeniaeformis]